jgi:two-component system, NtrC family, sensor kinase
MTRSSMTVFRSLSAKFIGILTVTLAMALTVSTYLNIRSETDHLIKAVQVSAERSSNVIKRGLRRAMQQNEQEVIHANIEEFAKEPGIDRIRIYDKRGRITYSTQSGEHGTVVNATAEACTMCHGAASVFTKTNSDQYMRVYSSPAGHRVLGFINPIQNEETCWNAACHAHTREQTVLGVLDIQLSLQTVDQHITSSTRSLLLSSLLTLLAVLVATGLLVYRGMHLPVKHLIRGTQKLATGDLDHRVDVVTSDEIGELARSFNGMADQLSQAQGELVDWSERLEEKVRQKTRELKDSESHIVHMERMASLGKLSSMIAHELNNPLAGILTYARLTEKRLSQPDLSDEKLATMIKDVKMIGDESKRCGDIVKNLLFFARGQEGVLAECDATELVRKSIRLIQHQLDLQNITVKTSLPEEGQRLICDQNQIQQVILALIMNAIEAMPEGGTLSAGITRSDLLVRIEVADTGIGIPEEYRQRIFEPFFTTKDQGAGVGLGLSIVYGIVKHHHGNITVTSTVGKGSSFLVELPFRQPTDASSPSIHSV